MADIFGQILKSSWLILAQAAPFMLFGFVAAGLLKAFLSEDFVVRHLKAKSLGAVLKASLLGVPLPLCSCGVIPAGVVLRKQGASRGASAAFMISTPESGVDSIAVTWALLDPVMTLFRPLAAFLTATVAGALINFLPEETTEAREAPPSSCGCSGHCHESPAPDSTPAPSLAARVRDGLAFAFGELLGDIGAWLLAGIVIAAVIGFFVPDDFFTRYLNGEWTSMLVMLGVGIPLYICASASTPVAAAMVLKGLSPGAALVFLLAGPATNAATLTVVQRFWGRKATGIYLASIAVCAVLLGRVVDQVYLWTGLSPTHWISGRAEAPPGLLAHACALVLLGLIAWQRLPRKSGAPACGCGGSGHP